MSHSRCYQPVKLMLLLLIFCFIRLVDFDRNGTERLGDHGWFYALAWFQ